LLQKIAISLKVNEGILIGSTAIFSSTGGHNPEHDNEFLSLEQLKFFLQFHFAHIGLWLSEWPLRTECYFQCNKPIILSEDRITQAIQEYNEFLEKK